MDEINELEQISHIISREEIEQFNVLLQKMHKANALLEQIENRNDTPDVPEGILPYELTIGVTCTVSQKGASVALAPSVVEKLQKVYYIDMTTDNYSDMVEAFLDKITDALSNTCSQFIPVPAKENHV